EGVHPTEVVLRHRVADVRRASVPFRCFGAILGHSLAPLIPQRQIDLRYWLSLVRSSAPPLYCLAVILRDALPLEIHIPEGQLRPWLALLGSGPAFPFSQRPVVRIFGLKARQKISVSPGYQHGGHQNPENCGRALSNE